MKTFTASDDVVKRNWRRLIGCLASACGRQDFVQEPRTTRAFAVHLQLLPSVLRLVYWPVNTSAPASIYSAFIGVIARSLCSRRHFIAHLCFAQQSPTVCVLCSLIFFHLARIYFTSELLDLFLTDFLRFSLCFNIWRSCRSHKRSQMYRSDDFKIGFWLSGDFDINCLV